MNVERAISFFSKKLFSAQRNYSTFERECLAVIFALEHFRVYLLNRPFRLRTDNLALQWLFAKEPTASARVSGWLATLIKYPIVIEYVRGSEYTIADALSGIESVALESEVPADLARGVPSFASATSDADRLDARTDWLAQQRADPTIAQVEQLLSRREGPEADDLANDPMLQLYFGVLQKLIIDNELVKHCNERAVSTRILVPAALRDEIFHALYKPAHHGYEASVRRITQRF